MAAFTKGKKVNTSKLKRSKVPLPEFDEGEEKGFIWVRALSAKEVRDKLATGDDGVEKKTSGNDLILLCAINEDGTPLFDNLKDVEDNLDVAAESYLAIINKICEISGVPVNKDFSKN